MLTVTEAARGHLAQMLVNANVPEEVAIRFVDEAGKIKPKLDNTRLGDTTFEHAGKTVLVLDEQMSHALSANTLDVQDASKEPQLILLEN